MHEIREILTQITARLGEAPDRTGELVLKRGELSDRLHRVLDDLKAHEVEIAGRVAGERNGEGKPVYPNEAARNAEVQRRLAADEGYRALKAEADRLRQEMRLIDAEIEQVGRRHRSDANLVYLVASLFQSGRTDLAETALAAYGQPREVLQKPEADAEPQAQAEPEPLKTEAEPKTELQAPKTGGLETGTFTVLEVRAGKSEGTVRAYCEGPDGKTAVYAKNGVAKVLSGAVGRKVEVRFRRLDKGLFAVEARPVA